MMGRALLMVGALATLAFLITGVIGYGLPETFEPTDLGSHLLIAVLASLLLLFSHCWILFYLIGTGKALKEAVKEHGLEADIVEQTKRFKTRSNPWLMLAMMLAMATFVIGGGVATEAVPSWVHHALFFVTLAAQVWALWVEFEVLAENEKLMKSVDRRLKRAAGDG